MKNKHIKLFEDINWNDWYWEENEQNEQREIPSGKHFVFYKQFFNKRVKIKPGSRFYLDHSSNNPKDVEGTINKINEIGFKFNVIWDNGCYNNYQPEDLILI